MENRMLLLGSCCVAAGLTLMTLQAVPLAAQSTAAVARQATPATVTIVTIGPRGDTLGLGSGFVVRANGVIITNYHVMRGADAAVIRFASGETFDRVEALDADASHDVAVLKIPGFALPVLAPAPVVPPVGAQVIAIGAPAGLDFTVSEGIVSAVRIDEGVQWIQMSAPISPGSSGGPVLNAQGQVIGISTMYRTDGQNLNFAVPIKYAMGLATGKGATKTLASVFGASEDGFGSSASQTASFTFPEPAANADATWLHDTYLLSGIRTRSGGGQLTDAASWTGVLLAAGENAGVILWGWDDSTSAPTTWYGSVVTDIFATARGRVLFSFADWVHQGYFTRDGGMALVADTIYQGRSYSDSLIASPTQFDLTYASGLYSLTWQPRWDADDSDEYPTSQGTWMGNGAVGFAGDSVYVALRVADDRGHTTYLAGSGSGSAESFSVELGDGTKLIGSTRSGQLTATLTDRRTNGVLGGTLTGRRE